MAIRDLVEIIKPDGGVEFYPLDPTKGITNIGRHPDNDIVIESSSVALFHAVLDHRQKPYHILVLSDEGDVLLDGKRLPPNHSTSLGSFGTLEMDGYALIFVEGADDGIAAAAAPPPPVAAPSPPVVTKAVISCLNASRTRPVPASRPSASTRSAKASYVSGR